MIEVNWDYPEKSPYFIGRNPKEVQSSYELDLIHAVRGRLWTTEEPEFACLCRTQDTLDAWLQGIVVVSQELIHITYARFAADQFSQVERLRWQCYPRAAASPRYRRYPIRGHDKPLDVIDLGVGSDDIAVVREDGERLVALLGTTP